MFFLQSTNTSDQTLFSYVPDILKYCSITKHIVNAFSYVANCPRSEFSNMLIVLKVIDLGVSIFRIIRLNSFLSTASLSINCANLFTSSAVDWVAECIRLQNRAKAFTTTTTINSDNPSFDRSHDLKIFGEWLLIVVKSRKSFKDQVLNTIKDKYKQDQSICFLIEELESLIKDEEFYSNTIFCIEGQFYEKIFNLFLHYTLREKIKDFRILDLEQEIQSQIKKTKFSKDSYIKAFKDYTKNNKATFSYLKSQQFNEENIAHIMQALFLLENEIQQNKKYSLLGIKNIINSNNQSDVLALEYEAWLWQVENLNFKHYEIKKLAFYDLYKKLETYSNKLPQIIDEKIRWNLCYQATLFNNGEELNTKEIIDSFKKFGRELSLQEARTLIENQYSAIASFQERVINNGIYKRVFNAVQALVFNQLLISGVNYYLRKE